MSYSSNYGKILIVDDDPNIGDLLTVNLRSEGYEVDVESEAAKVARTDLSETHLMIIDAMDQEFDGFDLLKSLRNNPFCDHLGIIITAGAGASGGVIEALDEGADDFLHKPYSLRELVARIRSVMRRHGISARAPQSNCLTYQSLSVDLTSKVVTDNDQPIKLTATEYAILVLLLKNKGVPTSRRAIFENVWKDSPEVNNDRIVDTNISRLRKKLGNAGSYIQNRSGLGYMFVP